MTSTNSSITTTPFESIKITLRWARGPAKEHAYGRRLVMPDELTLEWLRTQALQEPAWLSRVAAEGTFAYLDEDGDLIRVHSDAELGLALAAQRAMSPSTTLFRLQLSPSRRAWCAKMFQGDTKQCHSWSQRRGRANVPMMMKLRVVPQSGCANGDAQSSAADATEGNEAPRVAKHLGFRCDGCQRFPIIGTRYHCEQCVDFDLCRDCHESSVEPLAHSSSHTMQVITKPVYKSRHHHRLHRLHRFRNHCARGTWGRRARVMTVTAPPNGQVVDTASTTSDTRPLMSLAPVRCATPTRASSSSAADSHEGDETNVADRTEDTAVETTSLMKTIPIEEHWMAALCTLKDMGFDDRVENTRLLKLHKGNMVAVVSALCGHSGSA